MKGIHLRLIKVAAIAMMLVALVVPGVAGAAPLPRTEVTAPSGYEAAVKRIPAEHWALVGSVVIDRTDNGMSERKGLKIHLPPAGRDAVGVLGHEVSHIVWYANPWLEQAWIEQFWPGGKIRGTPTTGYGRKNPDEDFAEAYQAMIEGEAIADRERRAFMVDHVFVPLVAPAQVVAAPAPPRAPAPVQAAAPSAPTVSAAPTTAPVVQVAVLLRQAMLVACGGPVPAGSVVAGCSSTP